MIPNVNPVMNLSKVFDHPYTPAPKSCLVRLEKLMFLIR